MGPGPETQRTASSSSSGGGVFPGILEPSSSSSKSNFAVTIQPPKDSDGPGACINGDNNNSNITGAVAGAPISTPQLAQNFPVNLNILNSARSMTALSETDELDNAFTESAYKKYVQDQIEDLKATLGLAAGGITKLGGFRGGKLSKESELKGSPVEPVVLELLQNVPSCESNSKEEPNLKFFNLSKDLLVSEAAVTVNNNNAINENVFHSGSNSSDSSQCEAQNFESATETLDNVKLEASEALIRLESKACSASVVSADQVFSESEEEDVIPRGDSGSTLKEGSGAPNLDSNANTDIPKLKAAVAVSEHVLEAPQNTVTITPRSGGSILTLKQKQIPAVSLLTVVNPSSLRDSIRDGIIPGASSGNFSVLSTDTVGTTEEAVQQEIANLEPESEQHLQSHLEAAEESQCDMVDIAFAAPGTQSPELSASVCNSPSRLEAAINASLSQISPGIIGDDREEVQGLAAETAL